MKVPLAKAKVQSKTCRVEPATNPWWQSLHLPERSRNKQFATNFGEVQKMPLQMRSATKLEEKG